MQGTFFHRLPVVRGRSPIQRGLAEGALVLVPLTLVVAFLLRWANVRPTPSLLIGIAEVGAALLIAYAVVIARLVQDSGHRPRLERESRLGAFLGTAAFALAGILLALCLSQRAATHHWGWVDDLLLGCSAASVFMLGLVVVMQPWIVHEWLKTPSPGRSRSLHDGPPIRSRRF